MSNARTLANLVPDGLDDYEEGTWTPTAVVSGFTTPISSLSGKYTKVGQAVILTMTLTLSSIGRPTTYSEFSGIPFTVTTVGQGGYIGSSIASGLQSGIAATSGASLFWDRTSGSSDTIAWHTTITYFTS